MSYDGLDDDGADAHRAAMDYAMAHPDHPDNVVELHPDDEQPRPTFTDRLLTIADLAAWPKPIPLIEGLLDVDSLGVLYGKRGAYKSFLALDWSLSIATGRAWDGHAVAEPGVVLYVAAEGVTGIYQRIAAWRAAHDRADPQEHLLVLPQPVNLLSPSDAARLSGTAKEVDAVLVVVDTLARCMIGGDENSARDMGMAVDALDSIRRASDAQVLAVHHSGKDGSAGARGSSALEAAADSVLEMSATEGRAQLKTTKQKNRAQRDPIRLRAMPEAGSIVLVPDEGPAGDGGPLTGKELEALDVLASISTADGASWTDWIEAASEAEISRTTVRRARKKAWKVGPFSPRPKARRPGPDTCLGDQKGPIGTRARKPARGLATAQRAAVRPIINAMRDVLAQPEPTASDSCAVATPPNTPGGEQRIIGPGMKTTTAAAADLGYCGAWVRQLCARGDLPGAVKAGRTWLIPPEAVELDKTITTTKDTHHHAR